ncbi:MAG: hypothetical protein WBH08_00750 [Methanothrix sp.]
MWKIDVEEFLMARVRAHARGEGENAADLAENSIISIQLCQYECRTSL